MGKLVIENGILKAYSGRDTVVVVPDGVTQIGGEISDADRERGLQGDFLGYRAFHHNKKIEELYLPDSVEKIGYKSLDQCKSLRILSFSNKMREFGCNAINGCSALKIIIYRGTIYEFTCLKTLSQTPDLEVVYCTDGQICFGEDRKYFIDTLYFPGTRAQWEETIAPTDWRNKKCKKIICLNEM